MSEILYKGIASALKIDAEELIAKLKSDGGEWLPETEISKLLVSELTTAAAAATESAKDIAHRKGQSEMSKKFLKLIKNSGFENPDNLSGDELFEAFASWKSQGAGDNPPSAVPLDQWTREDLEKLPVVKALKLEAVQAGAQKFEALKKDFETKQAEFEQFKRGVVESKTKSIARKRFEAALEKGNIVLQVDGLEIDKNERVDAAFDRFWARKKIGLNKNEDPIFLNDDGEEDTDLAFGKPFDFDEVAVSIAKPMYGVSTQNPNHSGSGIQSTAGGKPAGYTPSMRFDNQDQYANYVMNEADPGKRAEATRSWQHQQSKAAGN
jgi:hypothetical protein